MSDFQTRPDPTHPDRCPSIDPHDELQCGRRIHEDDQCQFDGIGWRKGSPRYVSDAEKIADLTERVRVAEAAVARGLALADRVDADARKYQHPARLGTGDLRAALTTPTRESGTDEGGAS